MVLLGVSALAGRALVLVSAVRFGDPRRAREEREEVRLGRRDGLPGSEPVRLVDGANAHSAGASVALPQPVLERRGVVAVCWSAAEGASVVAGDVLRHDQFAHRSSLWVRGIAFMVFLGLIVSSGSYLLANLMAVGAVRHTYPESSWSDSAMLGHHVRLGRGRRHLHRPRQFRTQYPSAVTGRREVLGGPKVEATRGALLVHPPRQAGRRL